MTKITFECITNNELPYVQAAVFVYKGEIIKIERHHTNSQYDPATGTMTMVWSGIYIYRGEDDAGVGDGDGHDYNIPSDFFEDAKLITIELEENEEMPEGYEFKCNRVYIDNVEIASEVEILDFCHWY